MRESVNVGYLKLLRTSTHIEQDESMRFVTSEVSRPELLLLATIQTTSFRAK